MNLSAGQKITTTLRNLARRRFDTVRELPFGDRSLFIKLARLPAGLAAVN